jgi:hypothetical protein
MVSSFCRGVGDNCVLLGCYSASSGNFLPAFPINLSATCSVCPETSVINYHYSLRNNPEERSYQWVQQLPLPLYGGSVPVQSPAVYVA